MDIVKTNFEKEFPNILNAISSCSFMSWDGEYTGIKNQNFKAMPFDTLKERYSKLRLGNMNYLMCQVGLTFYTETAKNSYCAKSYNFYILPGAESVPGKSPQFICQASCVEFLASHGFDFNKVFREGISYLRDSDEVVLKKKIMERKAGASASGSSPISILSADDMEFVQSICKEVDDYLTSGSALPTLDLKPSNAYRRKLTYQHLLERFPSTIHLQAKGAGNQRFIQVTKVSNEEKISKEEEDLQRRTDDLQRSVGFSRIVKAIAQSKKLIVGHNMLLDLMYVISQFWNELPEEYTDFKEMAHLIFPRLLDTKTMSSTYLFKETIPFTSLDEMLKSVESPPFEPVHIDIAEGFPQYEKGSEGQGRFHDAAYDSFVTGKCFLAMFHWLSKKAEQPPSHFSACSELLAPFLNKLFVNRLQDIPYLNLDGPDAEPDRDHVYHLTFPKTWSRSDILQVFSPFPVHITWINDTSAMATLQQRADKTAVKKKLETEAHGCVVHSYYQWHNERAELTKGSGCDGVVLQRRAEPDRIESLAKTARFVKEAAEDEGLLPFSHQPSRKRKIPSSQNIEKEEERSVYKETEAGTKRISKEFQEDASW